MNCNTVTLENDPAGIFDFLTELDHFTSLNVFFQRGRDGPPPSGRLNPPIASMAVCEVSDPDIQKSDQALGKPHGWAHTQRNYYISYCAQR